MSLFVEVFSVDKNCKVIINLDEVVEIAPLNAGGCAIFFSSDGGGGTRPSMTVKDSYEQFQQFVMKTVSAEDIAARFPPRGRGRPPKAIQETLSAPTEPTPYVGGEHPGATW